MKTILTIATIMLLQTSAFAAVQSFRSFAVFKASYNEIGSNDVQGGLAGTAFFVSPRRALSAEHVINPALFRPNPGFRHAQVWLMNEKGGVVEIKESQIRVHAGKDLAEVNFDRDVVSSAFIFAIARSISSVAVDTSSEGYQAGTADAQLEWVAGRLAIRQVRAQIEHRRGGRLLQMAKVNLNASDVKLTNADCFHVSASSVVGMSGGPTLMNGQVIGVNSFGYPVDSVKKDSTWVVSLANLN